ncbi:hypothetical protein [Maritalea porphyrae]|uniref:hypothetical protein n=1 Tax=Maritalea porphyrae TaxID=880732 RepID=UPI0022B06C63|nr:hypothetical protein [Maritalea porphyrae]MCZ4272955.1 hypothetical protein [Maritalea porphyrae]
MKIPAWLNKENFEWFYKLVRKAPYVRVTGLGIATSVAILTTPIWWQILLGAASKYDVGIGAPPHPLIGLAIFVVSLAFFYVCFQTDRKNTHDIKAAKRDHDKIVAIDLVKKSVQPEFMNFLIRMERDHAIFSTESYFMYDLCVSLLDKRRKFSSLTLEKARAEAGESLNLLNEFRGMRFFPHGNADSSEDRYFALEPNLNLDRSRNWSPEFDERYRAVVNEMVKLLDRFENSYNTLLDEIREELQVSVNTVEQQKDPSP